MIYYNVVYTDGNVLLNKVRKLMSSPHRGTAIAAAKDFYTENMPHFMVVRVWRITEDKAVYTIDASRIVDAKIIWENGKTP